MSASGLSAYYEDLRRRASEGRPGGGLAVLRQQGLYAWVLSAARRPSCPPPLETSPREPPQAVGAGDRSPLVNLCTEMLLANLLGEEAS